MSFEIEDDICPVNPLEDKSLMVSFPKIVSG